MDRSDSDIAEELDTRYLDRLLKFILSNTTALAYERCLNEYKHVYLRYKIYYAYNSDGKGLKITRTIVY